MEKNNSPAESEESRGGNQPTKAFAYDDLKMTWRKYAYIVKEKGLDTLYAALVATDPILQDNYVIQLSVANDVQKNFVDANETDLLSYLRKELENYTISLKCEVSTEQSNQKELYSGQDKFKDMVARNPHLKTLQQRFKLDIEF